MGCLLKKISLRRHRLGKTRGAPTTECLLVFIRHFPRFEYDF
jgi:hypothetical protein